MESNAFFCAYVLLFDDNTGGQSMFMIKRLFMYLKFILRYFKLVIEGIFSFNMETEICNVLTCTP